MIVVIVLFFQTFLFGFTSAQECKIPCTECKEIVPPMPAQYVGSWNLIDPSSNYCPEETPCLYQEQNMTSWMCFCDPGNIFYEDPCSGNCPNCKKMKTDSVQLLRLEDFGEYKFDCSDGYALNGFNLVKDTNKEQGFFMYDYYCCKFNQQQQADNIDTVATNFNPFSNSVSALTNQNVNCPAPNAAIKGFQLTTNLGSNTFWYNIDCPLAPTSLNCSAKRETTVKGGSRLTALFSLEVKCTCNRLNDKPLLGQFQLKENNLGVFYEYTCCSEL